MLGKLSPDEEAQLNQTIEMFEVITQSQPQDYQSLEILKEAYFKLGRQKDVTTTAKRIAQAYVQLGQLSSAILEYETILQAHPDDADALAAMRDIETKANSLTQMPAAEPEKAETQSRKKGDSSVDDGRKVMQQLFVDSKMISMGDFEMCWFNPNFSDAPGKVIEPFLQVMHDKAIAPLDKTVKIVVDKARLGYLPLEKYDIDIDLARSFPREVCQRWCILPFDRMSKSVMVATANPFNKQAQHELQAATQNRLLWYVTSPADLLKVMKKVFR
jgi:tetratricopeptide (TPR) repeat protein